MLGLRSSTLKPLIIIAVVCVRFIALPAIGIWIVKAASSLGFLPSDPLYHYVLMVQFTLPPAMNIGKYFPPLFDSLLSGFKLCETLKCNDFAGTMTQLFDVAQEECSVLFLWTYLVAAVALTAWSTVYMWILS